MATDPFTALARAQGGCIILDGGFATQLESHGEKNIYTPCRDGSYHRYHCHHGHHRHHRLLLTTTITTTTAAAAPPPLTSAGADLSDALWSARLLRDDPSMIARVHTEYTEAGADVAITATYQASFTGL